MTEIRDLLLAPCGMDCGKCDLHRLTVDPQAAERVAAWFKKGGWLKENEGAADLVRQGPQCNGCRGDRLVQWSGDCGLRRCCLDERELSFCYECGDFACEELDSWAKGYAHHAQALERLQEMHRAYPRP